jgi:hypothetical protein
MPDPVADAESERQRGRYDRLVDAYEEDVRQLMAERDAAIAERDAAREELLEKWELYRACNGAEVYDTIDPRLRKLYMQLNAQARGDETDLDGDPIEQWNRLVELTVTAVARWIAASRWAVNEHQRAAALDADVARLQERLDARARDLGEFTQATVSRTKRLERDRHAYWAMVESVRDDVREAIKCGHRGVSLDDLAGIVGWPAPRPDYLDDDESEETSDG